MVISAYEWLMFTVVLVSAMLIPGPGVMATVAFSLTLGARRAFAFVFGAAFGDLTFLWVALLGLGVFVKTASPWLLIVLVPAAFYFARMSYGLMQASRQVTGQDVTDVSVNAGIAIPNSYIGGFMSGYSLTITNPKVIIFYLFILPALLNVPEFGVGDYVIVSFITPTALIIVLGTYALATGFAKRLLASARFGRVINLFAAVVFGLVALLLVVRAINLIWQLI